MRTLTPSERVRLALDGETPPDLDSQREVDAWVSARAADRIREARREQDREERPWAYR